MPAGMPGGGAGWLRDGIVFNSSFTSGLQTAKFLAE